MSQIRNRLTQVFRYLREIKGCDEQIVRDLKKYDQVWWQTDLDNIRGISLAYQDELDDAWMTIQRPFIPVPPALPDELKDWVLDWSDPDKEPKPVEKLGDQLFSDDSNRVSLLEEWIRDTWNPWADDAKVHWRTKKVYDELFSYYHELLEEGEEKEIAWGHGLLTWGVGNLEIQRHILVTPLNIDFDPDSGVFRLSPKACGTLVETDMLTQVHFSNAKKLHEIIASLDVEANVRLEKEVAPFLQKIIHLISPDGQYYSTDEPYIEMWESPRISYTPALFIRKRAKKLWEKELDHTLKKLGEGLEIPSHLARLVTVDEEEIKQESLLQEDWSDFSRDVLYPLPYNRAQHQVVERLATSDGLVLQGAPGTGKSHTIVNVLSHALAQGKRVLVTSEKERSLEVITRMIPEEIRPFCVRMLGGDRKAMKEVEQTIRYLTEGIERKSTDQLLARVEQLQHEREQLLRELDEMEAQLESCALLEHEQMLFSGKPYTAVSASNWLQQNEEHNWFPDSIKTQEAFPLSREEQKEFIRLLHRFSHMDTSAISLKRPSLSEIPTPDAFQSMVRDLHQLEEQYKQSERAIKEWNINQNITHLIPSALHTVEQAIQELNLLTQYDWQLAILKDETLQERWKDFVLDFREKCQLLQALEHNLLEYEFSIPSDRPIPQMKQDAKTVMNRMRQEKNVGRWFRHITGRHLSYLFKECLVNDKPPQTIGDFQALYQQLDCLEIRHRLALKWNRLMQPIGGPTIESDHLQLTMVLDELLQQVEYLLGWQEQIIQPLLPVVQSLGVPVVDWFNVEWHQQLHLGLKTLEISGKRDRLQQAFHQLHQKLMTGQVSPKSHPIWGDLLEACRSGDHDRWSHLYKELMELEKLEPAFQKYQNYLEKLEEVAPCWLASLMERVSSGEHVEISKNVDKAWLYSQLSYYMKKVPLSSELMELEKKYHQLKQKEEQLIRKLITHRAWLDLQKKTTDAEKRSLITWLQQIRKMSSGKGKYFEQDREDAKKELQNCKLAVPVWMMPIHKVIDYFSLDDQLFDLIIIDESSQSSLLSLSLMLRAKKFLVVGDENQIAPEIETLDHSFNRDLMNRYLSDIPQASQLDWTTSLYDTANRIFPEKVLLKEHFRSVPPIIAFNNQLMYGEEIVALRPQEQSKLPGGAVQSVLVAADSAQNGVNKKEAEAIVKRIQEMMNDASYDGKSIGVISLTGVEQAKYVESLIKQNFSEKQILKYRLVAGDAYRFQGDERDIILLSMVVTEKKPKPLVDEQDLQYYNVAASRARDQLILFHSITAQDLHPDCVRRTLLEHCQEKVELRSGGREKLDSELERQIYDWLTAQGYQVFAKVKLGWETAPIDLLVQGKKNRLAIQIEGDSLWEGIEAWREGLKQQRVLERIGWKFYRLFASRFTQDQEEVLATLQKRLLELGIVPDANVKEETDIVAG